MEETKSARREEENRCAPLMEKGATSGSVGMPSCGRVDLNLAMLWASAAKKSFCTERSVWNS